MKESNEILKIKILILKNFNILSFLMLETKGFLYILSQKDTSFRNYL